MKLINDMTKDEIVKEIVNVDNLLSALQVMYVHYTGTAKWYLKMDIKNMTGYIRTLKERLKSL